MTTLANVAAALRDRFDTETGSLPTAWDNQEFEPADITGVSWARFVVQFNETDRITLGDSARFRQQGLAIAQVFTKKDRGDDAGWTWADTIVNAFRAKKFSGVVTRSPWAERIGDTQDGWWQINVFIPFYSDATT